MWTFYPYGAYGYLNGNRTSYFPPFQHQGMNYYYNSYIDPHQYMNDYRQRPIRGQATWTTGGQVTKCGIPWSKNEYMTVAVGENSPFKCGQTLKIRNLSSLGQREIIVTVVDTVQGYPANKINLHRNAFIALGANPNVGIIDVEIIPSPQLEEERWGKYLLEIAQMAYPTYNVTEYNFVSRSQLSPSRTRETYEFILQAPEGSIKIQGNVIYNPITDKVLSLDMKEVEHFRYY
ncbi:DUF3889 domain-containing protein [Calidifontibacillus erzurumensis]|uniref:DUF3889 domain-containing protein n=1 Tax=Calidifontibacillus erzurumensis TaxID=2741433 RepID=A0A8J8GBJ5_9BACI|nr:DUF3889 domain-containing protein [Calidifontibacillus erzurumensis]NSL50519.1 DUF3889 domain-containing protein [Calidifontibacillus erzurumensis]